MAVPRQKPIVPSSRFHLVRLGMLLAAASAALACRAAGAQTVTQTAENPPAAQTLRGADAPALLGASPDAVVAPSVGGEASWSARIDYTPATIFNPRTGTFDKVHLRSYQG